MRTGSAMSKNSTQNLNASSQGGPAKSAKEAKNNDWIPTQAVRAILKIKEDFDSKMSEVCVSQILYELNSIWREIMRKENNAIKKRLNEQIQDLRRQVVTKQAFDKTELMQEISRQKKELAFANKQLYNKRVMQEGAGGATAASSNLALNNELENSLKLVETISY